MTIREFQRQIESIYFDKDGARGLAANVAWLVEEVGELARALRKGSMDDAEAEFADVLAWLCTLASLVGVDLETVASRKYARGCPKCGNTPCSCSV